MGGCNCHRITFSVVKLTITQQCHVIAVMSRHPMFSHSFSNAGYRLGFKIAVQTGKMLISRIAWNSSFANLSIFFSLYSYFSSTVRPTHVHERKGKGKPNIIFFCTSKLFKPFFSRHWTSLQIFGRSPAMRSW